MKLDFSTLNYEDLCLICHQCRDANFDDITITNPAHDEFELFIGILHIWFPEMFIYIDARHSKEFPISIETEDLITWR